MARKSADLFIDAPVKHDKIGRAFLAQLDKFVPEPGFEEQWQQYVRIAREHEDEQARYDAIYRQVEKEGGRSDCKSYPAFVLAGKRLEMASRSCFGALDFYMHAVKHKDDKKGVPEPELRAIIIDSISDKLDDIEFNINHGMLGSKVAQAIRLDTSEGLDTEPVFCADCAA